MWGDLKSCIGRKVKDFVSTPVKDEFVIIFEDNRALWFHEKPYAIGSVREIESRDRTKERKVTRFVEEVRKNGSR